MTYPELKGTTSRDPSAYPLFAVLLACVVLMTQSGCDTVLPVQVEDSRPLQARRVNINQPAPGFTIADASLTISALDYVTTISHLTSDSFTFLFLWVKDNGLFVVSLDGPHFAEEAGQFSKKVLQFSCAGIDVVFENSKEPLFSDNRERSALVTYFPNYVLFVSDVRLPNLVLGLADEFTQIPGFDHRNLPPESCFTRN